MYNLFLFQKASQHYQICCILRRNTAAILRIFSRIRSFIACHIPYWRSRHKSDLTRSCLRFCRDEIWARDNCRWTRDDIYLPQLYINFRVDKHVMICTCCNFISTVRSKNTWWYIHGATLYQLSCWWIRDNIYMPQF